MTTELRIMTPLTVLSSARDRICCCKAQTPTATVATTATTTATSTRHDVKPLGSDIAVDVTAHGNDVRALTSWHHGMFAAVGDAW
jgi:hypothetical protein